MHTPSPSQVFGPAINRFADVMAHHNQFAFKGVSRLAHEAGVSPSSLSRLINGRMNPSFLMVARLTDALEHQFGFHIDPRDLVAENGRFPTRFTCSLVGCKGCLPERARDEFGATKQAYTDITPGHWVTSRFPMGYLLAEEAHE
jgi:transcriptional regulator with XRE-family HTH domain